MDGIFHYIHTKTGPYRFWTNLSGNLLKESQNINILFHPQILKDEN